MCRRVLLLLAILSLATSTGCMTAIKQAYYGVRGADGKFYEIKVVDPDVLVTYEAIRFEPFTNDLGDHVPQRIIDAVNTQAPETVQGANIFYPEGKTLVVTGRIIHFTGKSGIEGSVGSVIGGGDVCACRVQLTDAESGNRVGEAVCWGIVKSAVRRGSTELGIGVGKGLIGWFEERLPEDVLIARQEELGGEKEVGAEDVEKKEDKTKDDKPEDKDADSNARPDEDAGEESEEKPETKPAEGS